MKRRSFIATCVAAVGGLSVKVAGSEPNDKRGYIPRLTDEHDWVHVRESLSGEQGKTIVVHCGSGKYESERYEAVWSTITRANDRTRIWQVASPDVTGMLNQMRPVIDKWINDGLPERTSTNGLPLCVFEKGNR